MILTFKEISSKIELHFVISYSLITNSKNISYRRFMDSAPYGREVLDTGLRSKLTSLALEAVGTFIVRYLVLNDDILLQATLPNLK